MNIIFLDVDGVINSTRSMVAHHDGFKSLVRYARDLNNLSKEDHCLFNHIDPIAVKLLNRVTDVTGAVYVISSTHRKHIPDPLGNGRDMALMKKYFADFGLTGEVIGYTPCSDSGFRGAEIGYWLGHTSLEVENYAIIDDSDDMLDFQKEKYFVHTNVDYGFSFEDYKKTLRILGYTGEP